MTQEPTNQTMSPQDWFGVGLRLLGLWSIFSALEWLMALIDSAAKFSRANSLPNETVLLYTIGYMGFGLLLIANARFFTKLAYFVPATSDSVDESSAAT